MKPPESVTTPAPLRTREVDLHDDRRRECLRLLEGHRRAPATLDGTDDSLPAEAVDPEDAVALRRRMELLAAALADLDPLHREVVLLRDIQERSAPEAAAELGISVDALKSRLHRARVSLRDHVTRRFAANVE